MGLLTLVLKDTNFPLASVAGKKRVVIDTALSANVYVNGGDLLVRELEHDTLRFDRLPPHSVKLHVYPETKEGISLEVRIVAGCETVVELYLTPKTIMHGPGQTQVHATVTTCPLPGELNPVDGGSLIRRASGNPHPAARRASSAASYRSTSETHGKTLRAH